MNSNKTTAGPSSITPNIPLFGDQHKSLFWGVSRVNLLQMKNKESERENQSYGTVSFTEAWGLQEF